MSIGSIVGTVAGGALGSIVPGVGTALGASLGGALGGSIGGGGGGGSLTGSSMGTSTTSSATPNVPAWLLPYLQQNASLASGLATKPYQPYTGNQVQGLSAMQNQAGQLAQALPGQAQAGFNQSNAILSQVAQQGLNGINPQTLQSYMNPYTQQVMDASQKRQLQQYQLEHNQLEAQQGQIGAFGGSRSALAQGQLASNFEQQLSENQATQLQNNFTNAENMSMQGLGQAYNAAQGITQGTAANQASSLQNIGALQTAGGLEQQTGQNQLNAQYQNYLNAQAYPYQQLANSQNILNPIGSLTTGTNATGFNQQTGSPSLLQSAAGLGTIASGLGLGSSGSSSGFGNLFSSVGGGISSFLGGTGYGTGFDVGQSIAANPSFFAEGGLVTGSGSYLSGGPVASAKVPSLQDHISRFVDQYAQHYAKGGMVDLDKKYHNAQGIPYTHSDPVGLKKGGKIPLTSGLTNSGIGGIKRERQHYGQPYVKQDTAAAGYLRPNIKNAFSHGGLVAHYSYEDGGQVDDWWSTGETPTPAPRTLGNISDDILHSDDVNQKINSVLDAWGLPGKSAAKPNVGNLPIKIKPIDMSIPGYTDTGSSTVPAMSQAADIMNKPPRANEVMSDSPKSFMDAFKPGADKAGMFNGVNLPLLAMGSAILGDRSNSLMGAIGAGGKAYVGAAEEQQKASIENMLKAQQAQYYSQRGDSLTERTPAMIAEMQAKTKYLQNRPNSDPAKQEYAKALNAQLAQGVPMGQAQEIALQASDAVTAHQANPALPTTGSQGLGGGGIQAPTTTTGGIPIGTVATNPTTGQSITMTANGWQ